ncbi:MAG: transposase [candidate division Zixibacteria bacterium]|nr:transposase [candidate division Zixibacteria bacterium]
MLKRKNNRLALQLYKGLRAYFVTICTKDQQRAFTDSRIIGEQIKVLNSCCKKDDFSVWTYCFMPDHLHLLLVGEENSDLIKFIRTYKQLSGYGYKKITGKNLWQKSFYDHILRKEENIAQVVRYILENPTRKGLVANFVEYPFSGSLEYDKEIFKM